METFKLNSWQDGLPLEVALFVPEQPPKAIVQFSHGMVEHKERYYPFMEYLCDHGFAAIIHDHRGHGASVRSREDLGYFYTQDPQAVAEDLYQVTKFARDRLPGLPVYLFAHSMGTLVARLYLQTHDDAVEKVVLSGPPTYNPLTPLAVFMAKVGNAVSPHHRNKLFLALSFRGYVEKGQPSNSWISSDPAVLEANRKDPLCGYVFTNNGYLNLFTMMKRAYQKSLWQVKNPGLPIRMMAGGNDPVIQSQEKFDHLASFLAQVGYKDVEAKIYPGLRHELLNEVKKEQVWQDVLAFWEG